MILLGIETSTSVCSVGLANDSGLQFERSIVESHIHSEKLLTLIQTLCDEQKIKIAQLDGIAVSIGPGSFTGLRIGLSSAKGLCYALGKPLITVSTFEAISFAVFTMVPEFRKIFICLDAKQGEYYIALYEKNDGKPRESIPLHVGTLATDIASIDIPTTLIVTDRKDEVKKNINRSGLIENILPYCRGDVIATLGIAKLKAGEQSDLENLEPMYLKDFVVKMRS